MSEELAAGGAQHLYTNLDDSKLLAETGLMAGIEPDGCFIDDVFYDAHAVYDEDWATSCRDSCHSYRLDKLLMKLPDWCFEKNYNWCEKLRHNHAFDLAHEAFALFQSLLYLRGQPAIQATVKLLMLLKENGL
jgi:hypothetical protein